MRVTRTVIYKKKRRKRRLKNLGLVIRIILLLTFMAYFMTVVVAETLVKPSPYENPPPLPKIEDKEEILALEEAISEDKPEDNRNTRDNELGARGNNSNMANRNLSSGTKDTISLKTENADIRDVLSAIALGMGLNIIYMGEPTRISLHLDSVSYHTALDYILQGNGADYVLSDNTIIAAKKETLEKDFSTELLLARYDLKHITSQQLDKQIDSLGIGVRKLVFEGNDRSIWIQGTSRYLSKIKELIIMVDVPENKMQESDLSDPGVIKGDLKLVPFKLEFIDIDTFKDFIKQMDMDIKVLTFEKNPDTLWISAKEGELIKIEEIIKLMDTKENMYLPQDRAPLNLIPYKLEFVAAENIDHIVTEMGLSVDTLYIPSNPYKIWINSRSEDINGFEELIRKIDIMENGKWFIEVTTFKLEYLTASRFKEIVNQLNIPVNVITMDSIAYTVWVTGATRDVMDVKFMLRAIDTDIIKEDTVFFIKKLHNISSQEAVQRFELLKISDTNIFTLNFPQFAKEILVVCRHGREKEITDLIDSVDVSGSKIKMPVDRSLSSGGQSRLSARRDLISDLTGIPKTRFTISNNVSRDSEPLYIMWVEETPENIQKILDMIATIDGSR